MYFPTHFERRFCIFVHEKLHLRVRVEGVIQKQNTPLRAEFIHKIPHNPNTQNRTPQGFNFTLKHAQKHAFWGNYFTLRLFCQVLEYFSCAVPQRTSTAPKSVLTSADTVAAVSRGNDWTGTVTGHVTPRAGFMHRATNHRWQNSIEVLSRLCLRVKTHANPTARRRRE